MTKRNLILLSDPLSAAAEAYRTLRTNLMFSQPDGALHTLVVTSPSTGDGKDVLAANLAAAFAQGGHRTILVDADLRRPGQHDIWGCASDRGLTTMMLDDGAMANPPLVETGVDGLHLLPAGGGQVIPADLLSSQRMTSIIGVLKARAAFVVFDAPPVLAATDAAVLGAKVDGALLVVRAGQTRREDAARARQALLRVQVRILGAVLSNAPGETSSYLRR